MRIGIDFDNTIVCYDETVQRASLILKGVPIGATNSKDGLKEFLIQEGREEDWTEFQGYLYGPGLSFARPFTGFLQTLQELKREGCEVFVVSHKTRTPYAGAMYDLHAYANKWIKDNISSRSLGIDDSNTYLELTKEAKVERIKTLELDCFIDDLVPIVRMIKEKTDTRPILFDPNGIHDDAEGVVKMASWLDLCSLLR